MEMRKKQKKENNKKKKKNSADAYLTRGLISLRLSTGQKNVSELCPDPVESIFDVFKGFGFRLPLFKLPEHQLDLVLTTGQALGDFEKKTSCTPGEVERVGAVSELFNVKRPVPDRLFDGYVGTLCLEDEVEGQFVDFQVVVYPGMAAAGDGPCQGVGDLFYHVVIGRSDVV